MGRINALTLLPSPIKAVVSNYFRRKNNMSEQIFAVSGMHCNSCVMGVTEALTALDPVREVTVDLDPKGASTVRVLSDSVLSVEEVHDTLVRAGGDFAVAAG